MTNALLGNPEIEELEKRLADELWSDIGRKVAGLQKEVKKAYEAMERLNQREVELQAVISEKDEKLQQLQAEHRARVSATDNISRNKEEAARIYLRIQNLVAGKRDDEKQLRNVRHTVYDGPYPRQQGKLVDAIDVWKSSIAKLFSALRPLIEAHRDKVKTEIASHLKEAARLSEQYRQSVEGLEKRGEFRIPDGQGQLWRNLYRIDIITEFGTPDKWIM